MSIKALSDYTVYAKYANYVRGENRRETWREMVDRVFEMHAEKYASQLAENEFFRGEFEFAREMMYKKRVLGAQRALQFGGKGIKKHNSKLFNCSFTYIDRVRAFQEMMYLLLCGCGTGASVQLKHIAKLPTIAAPSGPAETYYVPDSIEGWADSVGVLLSSYFTADAPFPQYQQRNLDIRFDLIRPEGSLIAGQFKAPGPEPLRHALQKMQNILNGVLAAGRDRLKPIEAYDICMHAACCVLSGGIRRSASIFLFSPEDQEMMTAKTGNWMKNNIQRARSNNSVLLVRDKTSQAQFDAIIESTRIYGEPGFIFADSEDVGVNPCAEICLWPQTESGETGWQMCNLTEGNGRYCTTAENLYEVCRASATIGTMQAGYTDFVYLTPASKQITDREALLGCSITGMMDNPEILFNPEIQRAGAKLILEQNAKLAAILGIMPAARCCTIKPSGSTSCMLGTASGIHPHHAERYIRRVQANKNEFPLQYFEGHNPIAVEDSVWDSYGNTKVISFLCEVPRGAVRKNMLTAIELLEKVKLTQENWVTAGTRLEACVQPFLKHNVSNTITVQDNEWAEVSKYLYENRSAFTGVSLLPASGDLDYPQAPFTSVLNSREIAAEYGDGAALASGLIVDGLRAYKNNLWDACAKVVAEHYTTETNEQIDWVRRARQFADRYFEGDIRKMTHCLKHVHTLKTWLDLKREYKEIDWSLAVEEQETIIAADTLGAQGCAGGACEIPQ